MTLEDRKRLSKISQGENNERANTQLSAKSVVSQTTISNIFSGKSWKEGANHSSDYQNYGSI